jgi:hypothetical protein
MEWIVSVDKWQVTQRAAASAAPAAASAAAAPWLARQPNSAAEAHTCRAQSAIASLCVPTSTVASRP